MPRPAKGPRLWLRKATPRGRASAWFIKDGDRHVGTGCAAHEIERAQQKLAEHISAKYAPARRDRDLSEIPVADVLNIYLADVVPDLARPDASKKRLERLAEFFGDKTLDEVTGETCRAYVKHREALERKRRKAQRKPARRTSSPELVVVDPTKRLTGGARRDLEDLRAAIGHHSEEGLHRGIVRVKLPEPGDPRQRWLTRDEAARLVWVCHTHREKQEGQRTKKRPLAHLARFILLGAYTGSRPGVCLTASWVRGPGRSWIDVDAGLFYRRPEGARETNKRQPPVPIPPPLLRLLRRWKRQDAQSESDGERSAGFVVQFNGAPVQSVKTAMGTAARLAGLGKGVTGYTMRHTAGTWLMMQDVSIWMAARYLGTSPEIIEKHYAHHSPAFLREAAEKIGTKTVRPTVSPPIRGTGTRT